MTDGQMTNWKFHHLGLVVKDMDKAVEYYRSLGATEFEPEFLFNHDTFPELKQSGKLFEGPVKVRFRYTKVGPEAIELIAPIEGETLYKQFLETNGEGIQHIAFTVDDLDREIKKMEERGIPVILCDRRASFAYFDTRKVGGIIIELVKSKRS